MQVTGSWRTRSTLAMARRGAACFAYDIAARRLWSIPEPMALVFELAGHPELEDITSVNAICEAARPLGVLEGC
jgi:hypothetical protein